MKALTFLARRFVAGETAEDGRRRRASRSSGAASTPPSTCWARTCCDREAALPQRRGQQGPAAPDPGRRRAQRLHQAHDDGPRHLRRLLPGADGGHPGRGASEVGGFVRIDMEGSKHTQRTIDAFQTLRKTLRQRRHRAAGVPAPHRGRREGGDRARGPRAPLQGRLQGAAGDRLDEDGRHPRQLPRSARGSCWTEGNYPAIATHDESLVQDVLDYAREQKIGSERYEFQMLYGLRPRRWDELVSAGAQRPHLRALRHALVPVLLPPPPRAQGERLLRAARACSAASRVKAAVYRGPGDLRVEDVPVPGDRPGRAAGAGRRPAASAGPTSRRSRRACCAPPRVFGHEIAGRVAARRARA